MPPSESMTSPVCVFTHRSVPSVCVADCQPSVVRTSPVVFTFCTVWTEPSGRLICEPAEGSASATPAPEVAYTTVAGIDRLEVGRPARQEGRQADRLGRGRRTR